MPTQVSCLHVFTRSDRLKLDRRRFEASHLRYSMLKVMSRYPHMLSPDTDRCIKSNLAETLDAITPHYFVAFSNRYAGKYPEWLYRSVICIVIIIM